MWVEPYPDEILGVEDGFAAPEAPYEQREAVELAFIAALQHLPANQRAALIMREVLGFSAKETAETLDTTMASVNSALQRARKTIDDKLPEQSQQATLRALGDERGDASWSRRYVDAWERDDIDNVVAMLAEDATFAMPPLASWYGGREARSTASCATRRCPATGAGSASAFRPTARWRWRTTTWSEEEQAYLPFALNVLTFRGEEISDVTCFICRSTEATDRERYGRYPEEPVDSTMREIYFTQFGVPERLPGPK